ncbi:MAG: DMT family transporter [Asticcacaulis sp.]
MNRAPSSLLANPLVLLAALLVAMASVQSGAAFAKHLFAEVGPEGATALRQLFAALITLIVFRPWRNWPSRSGWRWLGLYGLCLGLMNLSFYMALTRIPLGIAVALEFLGPLAVAIGASRRWLDFVWVSCAVAGLWVLLPHEGAQALDPVGVGLALFTGLCWGSYILLGQRVSRQVNEGAAVSLGLSVSCLLTVPWALATVGPVAFAPAILPMGLMVALLSGAIPFTIEMFALKRLPAKTFGILMSLEPAMGAVSGLLFLGEILSGLQWAAIALIMVASAGSALSVRVKS